MYLKRKTSIKIVIGLIASFFIFVIGYKILNSSSSKIKINLASGNVQMEDFHRTATKNGKKVWEIFGKQVVYSPNESNAKITNVEVIFYDKKRGDIRLSSKDATIFLKQTEIDKIELYNDIILEVNSEFKALAEKAYYTKETDLIEVPGEVKLFSKFGEIIGTGLSANVNDQTVAIHSQVKSIINPKKDKL